MSDPVLLTAGIELSHSLRSDSDTSWDYLDLLGRAVCNYLYLGSNIDESKYPVRDELYNQRGWQLPKAMRPHTGLRLAQLANLHNLARQLIEHRIPGDFLEAGVWQGGVIIFLAGLLRVYRVEGVRLWALDTFSGIPRDPHPSAIDDPVDEWTDRWAVPLDEVQNNIRRYGLLDERIRFVCGPFRDSIPGADIKQLALLRIDADAYASTMDALELLYPRVSAGGHIIIDDWHLNGCRRAVLDYRAACGISTPIKGVYGTCDGEDDGPYEVFWTV
jgi:hypothetical protein